MHVTVPRCELKHIALMIKLSRTHQVCWSFLDFFFKIVNINAWVYYTVKSMSMWGMLSLDQIFKRQKGLQQDATASLLCSENPYFKWLVQMLSTSCMSWAQSPTWLMKTCMANRNKQPARHRTEGGKMDKKLILRVFESLTIYQRKSKVLELSATSVWSYQDLGRKAICSSSSEYQCYYKRLFLACVTRRSS